MLTHIDQQNNPTMVDVSDKLISKRRATALSTIILPEAMREYFKDDDFIMKKGPVFHTAIIAGTMAVKKTYDFIPFCHQIPIESCKFNINVDSDLKVSIECTVKTTFKTGVEMEALHGASMAALTIYDMCKAVSHEMVIGETKLIIKTGGKNNIMDRPLYGLILTGGKSNRMKEDKALLKYSEKPHALFLKDLITPFCKDVYLSAKEGQWSGSTLEKVPTISDSVSGSGPSIGIMSAFKKHAEANWLILACDLPYINEETIKELIHNYDPNKLGTAFKNKDKKFAEPLCTIYTPLAHSVFESANRSEVYCPVKIIKDQDLVKLDQSGSINLANINTPSEFQEVKNEYR